MQINIDVFCVGADLEKDGAVCIENMLNMSRVGHIYICKPPSDSIHANLSDIKHSLISLLDAIYNCQHTFSEFTPPQVYISAVFKL